MAFTLQDDRNKIKKLIFYLSLETVSSSL